VSSKEKLFFEDADWLVGVLLMTEQRNKRIDFPYPWFADRNNLVLPYPSQFANTAAPLEPFTLPVCILVNRFGILISIHVYRYGFS
jgi:hypothetical protein